MTHPDPFTSNTAFEEVMSEIESKADEGGGPEIVSNIDLELLEPYGGFAFPSQETDQRTGQHTYHFGMTLRDYLAAHSITSAGTVERDPKFIAERCYAIADAMLEARKVKT